MGLFAPPDLFSSVAVAARGDADLPDGGHLRLMPAPALGFPLAPFDVFRIEAFRVDVQVLWRDAFGTVLEGPALDAAGGILIGDIAPPNTQADELDIAVELVGDGFEGSLSLLDRVGNRLVARRSRAPFIVGGPRVQRVRIEGRGHVTRLRTWRVDLQRAVEPLLGRAPDAMLSLPIEGTRPWYAKGLGVGPATKQVARGAALRLQRPDQPDGPFDPLTRDDDVQRVSIHGPDLVMQCETMVGDIAQWPRTQHRKSHAAATPTRRQQFVDISISDTLLVHAMDPGLGRFLGLVGALDEQSDGNQPLGYVSVGLFAYSTATQAPDGRLVPASLGTPPPVVERIEELLVERHGAQPVIDALAVRYANVAGSALLLRLARLEVRPLIAVAGLVPPPDPPSLPSPLFGDARWLDGGGRPSETFGQQFLFPLPPLGALVALGRLEGGTWTTRHQTVELPAPANPSRRALAMLMGRSQAKPKIAGWKSALSSFMRRGLIADAPIPADDPGSSTYRAAIADLFGRFGAPAQFVVPTPPRPGPPAPAPQPQVVLDGPDGVGGPPASPGHVDLTVVVPSVAALAAGSLDIASLELSFDGGAPLSTALAPIPAGTSKTVSASFTLPALEVGTTGRSSVTAKFKDTAGVESQPVSVAVAYADRRRPLVIPTGLGLFWTSRPGPSPDVELKLVWPGAAGTRYRVYVADQKGLAIAGASRADVAVEGGQRDRAHTLGGRDRFRLLTEPPLETIGGQVLLNEHLPRALTTVQFLRVVPLTAQGREAEFDNCGVVPVAIPSDRTPPPPRVHVAVDPETRVATVTIEGVGLDLVELKESEPGLFTEPPAADAVAPEFRLRRASGLVNDPVFAREIARGPLAIARDGAAITFVTEVEDPTALAPYIRYSYWAEVRMPPERRLARGIVELPPPGGVAPVLPSQSADNPRAFSAVSAPASAIHLPPLPIPTLGGAVASVVAIAGTTAAALTAPATPSAPRAIGSYRLRIWEQWNGGEIVSSGPDIELDGTALDWHGTPAPGASHPLPLTLSYVVVDPVGRESVVTVAEA
jgi:hypothetical protein